MTETHNFQAEVSRLLSIVANALYSEREVFLRELISNASDACDRLRYQALTTPGLTSGTDNFKISLTPDKTNRTLTIADNGIGMNRDELIAHLGTIARSGTAEFMEKLAKDKSSINQIGQFGVGFYSCFMVSDKVEVFSKKAGESTGWIWTSDGKGSFTIEEYDSLSRGTAIKLYLKEGADEFLDEARLKEIVTRYSDHISFPIVIPGEDNLEKTLNSASALWMKSPKDITPEQYKEFYHHAGHAFDDPWLTLHWHAEGTLEYRALLFVPTTKPFDIFDPQRRGHVKLYVKRVFITEVTEGLLPPYLRFMRGIVDSEDLPLNISREMLQNNPVLEKIKTGLTKRILGDLAKESKSNPNYDDFFKIFGAVLKEGLYEDRAHSELILKLCRFHTTKTVEGDGKMIDLDTYIARMQEGQKHIYTISGANLGQLAQSPQIEGFKARGIEVLLMTESVDDFWPTVADKYGNHTFQSVTKGAPEELYSRDASAEASAKAESGNPEQLAELLSLFKSALGDTVADVRASKRLTTSAVCLVASDNDIDINLEKLLRAHKQAPQGVRRILEINPNHALIQRLAEKAKGGDTSVGDTAWLLLDQARIIEGEPLPDPVAFAQRMTELMNKGLAA